MGYWVPPEGGIGSPGPPAGGYPPEEREDKEIAEAVRLALFLDPDISEKQFVVTSKNGVVYLSGIARSEDERRRVHALALEVQDVREVIDQITVANTEKLP